MSASEESFTSETAAKEVGMVAKTLLDVFWGFRAGRDLMQQSSVTQGFGLGVELIMVLLSESEDSVSACSKNTYFTARIRARPRVITCSRSILEREKVIYQWTQESIMQTLQYSMVYLVSLRGNMVLGESSLFATGPSTVRF